jgi:hypothetical protein
LAGNNDADDIDGMIALFRRFRGVSLMSRTIAVWSEADEHIAKLDALADELHARISIDGVRPGRDDPTLARIFEVNQRLTELEVMFSNTLGEASRRTEAILGIALAFVATLLVVVGIAISWRILRTGDKLERALFAERDRARVTSSHRRRGHHDDERGSPLSEPGGRDADERARGMGKGHAA